MSVESDGVALVDLTGKEIDTFHFDRLKIHDVSVTPDGKQPVLVAAMPPAELRQELVCCASACCCPLKMVYNQVNVAKRSKSSVCLENIVASANHTDFP